MQHLCFLLAAQIPIMLKKNKNVPRSNRTTEIPIDQLIPPYFNPSQKAA